MGLIGILLIFYFSFRSCFHLLSSHNFVMDFSNVRYRKFLIIFTNTKHLDVEYVKKTFGYRFGFIGIYKNDESIHLYVELQQGSRIYHHKIISVVKILSSNLANEIKVETFTHCQGDCLYEEGILRTRGRKQLTEKMTNNINNNNTHNDNSVDNSVNDNRVNNIVINLHVNALGEEDISHIKEQMLSEIVKARIEEVQAEILGILSEERCSCESSSSRFPHSSVMCNVLHEYIHTRRRDNREEVSERGSDSDDSDRDDVRPICEPEEDSEEDSKERLRAIKDLICWKTREEGVFSNRFEELLYENPSNRNIKYSEGKGYFTYFDGNRFQNERKSDYYDRVIRKRLKKSAEWMNTLKDRKEMTDFQAEYVNTAIEFLSNLSTSDNPRTLKKMVNNSLQLAVNSEIKIPGVTVKKINDPENAGRFDTVEKIKGNAWEATRGRL